MSIVCSDEPVQHVLSGKVSSLDSASVINLYFCLLEK